MAECIDPRYFHFTLEFYSDQEMTNLVLSVSSKTYWEYFTVDSVPMTSQGALLCKTQCAQIRFSLPEIVPSEFDVLFNKSLFVKIGKPDIVYEGVITGNPSAAQILILIDESGSMKGEQAWIAQTVRDLEAGLVLSGIGPNDYGLVGFGGVRNRSEYPILHHISNSGHVDPFGSAPT